MQDIAKPDNLLEQLAEQLQTLLNNRVINQPLMVGIHTGGVWVAESLHNKLTLSEPLATLDISFYRDDFSRIGINPKVKPSHCMACKFCSVSSSVSPLLVADVFMFMFNTSADNLFAASSNVVRVLVLSSKNILTIVLPRNMGSFLTLCSLTFAKLSAVSMMFVNISLPRPSIVHLSLKIF